MSDTVIRLEGLSKQYQLGRRHASYRTLRDTIVEAAKSSLRSVRTRSSIPANGTSEDTIWALRDVTFDIKQGETVGLIGRNGSGKSTLLKILSRITQPTRGYADIYGRVGSLLEVGTGFHHELTGRENIFLNGAILGMRQSEIVRKFDEIVAFSEVEKFLDTPVKHYSSGMYVRLGFAVAAHLDPEILIVDEVLAVGDAGFQKKCLGKISEVSRGGRTVLFVSHNMTTVANLCHKGVLLQDGKVVLVGDMKSVVERYLQSVAGESEAQISHIADLSNAPGRGERCRSLLKRVELYDADDKPLDHGVPMGGALKFAVCFETGEPTGHCDVGLGFDNLFDQRVLTLHSTFDPSMERHERRGERVLICAIPSLTLVPGEYKIKVSLTLNNIEVDYVVDAVRLCVREFDYYGAGKLPWNGVCVMPHHWRLM